MMYSSKCHMHYLEHGRSIRIKNFAKNNFVFDFHTRLTTKQITVLSSMCENSDPSYLTQKCSSSFVLHTMLEYCFPCAWLIVQWVNGFFLHQYSTSRSNSTHMYYHSNSHQQLALQYTLSVYHKRNLNLCLIKLLFMASPKWEEL